MLVEAGEHHHVVLARAKAAAGVHPGESGRLCDSFEGGGPSGSSGHVRRRERQSPIGPRACSTHLRAVWARFLAEGWLWSRAQKPVGPRPSLARGRRPPHRRRELPGVCPTQTAPPRPARYSCVSGGRGARPPRWSPWGPRAAGGAWSGFGSCRADSASTRGTLWAAFAARSGCEATCRSGWARWSSGDPGAGSRAPLRGTGSSTRIMRALTWHAGSESTLPSRAVGGLRAHTLRTGPVAPFSLSRPGSQSSSAWARARKAARSAFASGRR